MDVVEPFAGPGGWSEALRAAGFAAVGIEIDPVVCATRRAAGHRSVRADVATYPPARFAGAEGIVASPPCPDWSVAGRRLGRAGATGFLIDTVPRWVECLRPTWVACEQVPPALPVWSQHARHYQRLGYSTWVGILNAADYGVPQVRQRAFLLARRDGGRAVPPVPTHHPRGEGRQRWITLADALGVASAPWPPADDDICPGCGCPGEFHYAARRCGGPCGGRRCELPSWAHDRPATTVTGDWRLPAPGRRDWAAGQRQFGHGAVHLSLAQALQLQSFPGDYPVVGAKKQRHRQVGNAVPPRLADAVVGALTGRAGGERPAPLPRSAAFRAVPLERATSAAELVIALQWQGLTQADIADAVGATDRSVRNWQAGRNPQPRHLHALRALRETVLRARDQGVVPARMAGWVRSGGQSVAF